MVYSTLRTFRAELNREFSDFYSEREVKSIVDELFINVLKFSHSDLILRSNDELPDQDLKKLESCIKRLRKGEPWQYITGEVLFCDLSLISDSRALIPRPETEELVQWVVDEFQDANCLLIDVCSGSGCIALALKNRHPGSTVFAMELSPDAVDLIEANKERTGLNIEVLKRDVLKSSAFDVFEDQSVDVIVSNPPYVLDSDKDKMSDQVLKFEPHMALFVDDSDPLIFYEAIAKQALKKLKDNGLLFFEVHEELAQNVVKLLAELGFVNIEVRKDLQGKERMVRGIR